MWLGCMATEAQRNCARHCGFARSSGGISPRAGAARHGPCVSWHARLGSSNAKKCLDLCVYIYRTVYYLIECNALTLQHVARTMANVFGLDTYCVGIVQGDNIAQGDKGSELTPL